MKKFGFFDVLSIPAGTITALLAAKQDSLVTGTWTPSYYCSSVAVVAVYGVQSGNYIKIGNLVIAWFHITTGAFTGTGDAYIDGLPFSLAASNASAKTGGGITSATDFGGDHPSSLASISSGTSRVGLFYRSTVNGATQRLQGSDFSNGALNNQLTGFVVYTV